VERRLTRSGLAAPVGAARGYEPYIFTTAGSPTFPCSPTARMAR
jgi:hypothetical protein